MQGFWQFVDRQSSGNAARRDLLGALLVGRSRTGEPLVAISDKPIPGIDPKTAAQNNFTYEGDPLGRHCPVGAHLRRANPRTSDFPAGTHHGVNELTHMLGFGAKWPDDDLISSTRFHRVLRRGREYGPELKPEEASKPGPPDGIERGLRFIALNANIERQFEFIQQAWLTYTKFAGLTEQSDPLVGTREPVAGDLPTDNFEIPQDGLARCITGMPQFVTVRGGGYFFLPGLRALRYIAR